MATTSFGMHVCVCVYICTPLKVDATATNVLERRLMLPVLDYSQP